MTISDVAAYLRAHDDYLILTHRGPDGDTLGSAAALCLALQELEKTCYICEHPEITPKYGWLVDDLIATGGTIEAAAQLIEELGGEVVKIIFLMELAGLKGREKLAKYDVESVICYEGK